ncbi:unnamed protein product [Ectocarpus sp. 6 AP-2014]
MPQNVRPSRKAVAISSASCCSLILVASGSSEVAEVAKTVGRAATVAASRPTENRGATFTYTPQYGESNGEVMN